MYVLILALALPLELRAYTDPGSGILIWQIVVAAIAAFGFRFRRFFTRFVGKK